MGCMWGALIAAFSMLPGIGEAQLAMDLAEASLNWMGMGAACAALHAFGNSMLKGVIAFCTWRIPMEEFDRGKLFGMLVATFLLVLLTLLLPELGALASAGALVVARVAAKLAEVARNLPRIIQAFRSVRSVAGSFALVAAIRSLRTTATGIRTGEEALDVLRRVLGPIRELAPEGAAMEKEARSLAEPLEKLARELEDHLRRMSGNAGDEAAKDIKASEKALREGVERAEIEAPDPVGLKGPIDLARLRAKFKKHWDPATLKSHSRVHEELTEYAYGKTSAIFKFREVKGQLVSGQAGPAENLYRVPFKSEEERLARQVFSHVEGHAIAVMEEFGIAEADLYVNFPGGPCDWGCQTVIPKEMKSGYELNIIYEDYNGVRMKGSFEKGRWNPGVPYDGP